ncbi:MAG: hypothetical protein LBB88_02960 [Planctomycetaceae bacterium]|nr:hypothetical protein [Planctomycetaceae bacterium]
MQLYIAEGGLISKLTTASYMILLIAFIGVFLDFLKSGYLCEFFIFLWLSICAFAREQELIRWFIDRQNVAVNLKFIFNSSNRLFDKILIIFIFLTLIFIFVYLARKYALRIIIEFFNFGVIAWSFSAFVCFFLVGQFIDELPKIAKPIGWQISKELYLKLELIEECTELFLPIIVTIIFVQYHFLLKVNKKK